MRFRFAESRSGALRSVAPAGWQMTVELRNKGPAPAYGLDVWLTDSDGTALTHRYAHPEAVAPGDLAGSMPIWRRHHSRAPRIGRPTWPRNHNRARNRCGSAGTTCVGHRSATRR